MIISKVEAPARDKPFTVRLSADEKRRLASYAATHDLRIAQVVRKVIRESLPPDWFQESGGADGPRDGHAA